MSKKILKILLLGKNGMLGRELLELLERNFPNFSILAVGSKELDITDRRAVHECLLNYRPTWVINCAAYTNVSKAETEDVKRAMEVNGNGPEYIAQACACINAKLIHVSTDYVFDGKLDLKMSYKTNDETNPINNYGMSKLMGENNVKDNMENFYILRTSGLYGKYGINFVDKMYNFAKNNEERKVVCDQHISLASVTSLCNIIVHFIENSPEYGVYHAVNNGFTTWYDIAYTVYNFRGDKTSLVTPVPATMFFDGVERPYNSKLDNNTTTKTGLDLLSWKDALELYLREK